MFHDPCFLIEFGGGNLLGLLLFDNATEYITLCNYAWKGLFVHTFCADICAEAITTWVFSADPSSGGFWAKRKGAQREVGARGQLEFMGAVPFKDGVCISVIYEYLMVQVNSSHLKKRVYVFSHFSHFWPMRYPQIRYLRIRIRAQKNISDLHS